MRALVLVLALGLVGCGPTDGQQQDRRELVAEPTAENEASTTEPASDDLGWGEPSELSPKTKALVDKVLAEEAAFEAGLDPATLIRAKCKTEWSNDYEMQKFCLDEERGALSKLVSYRLAWPEGSEERKILERCAVEWAGADGAKAEYAMVIFCFDEQLDAYRSLQ